LAARGDSPAVHAFAGRPDVWSFAKLGTAVRRLSAGLRSRGLTPGEPVALLAPNEPRWIAAYLAVLHAGAVAMPLDERADDGDILHLLKANQCRWIATTSRRCDRLAALAGAEPVTYLLLDAGEAAAENRIGWERLASDTASPPPEIRPADIAVIVHTSGTTGTPKAVPLTHANLMSNITALLAERLVTPGDCALLPLPLHHVYPMTVGMLTPLAAGATVVLPAGISGPELTAALRDGNVTHLVGVPRLYTALVDGIRSQVRHQGGLLARLFPRLLRLSARVTSRFHIRIGRALFSPLHRRLGPRLRVLVSGGAALDPEAEDTLTALGWEVLTGYGLTETSPILAFTRRGTWRRATAGQPLPGVDLRIANPDGDGVGELEARGASVFAGYRHNPEATAKAFTEDGWFRTGDLAVIDADRFVSIRARVAETIVLPGGKKIFPETVEAVYGDSPLIAELALLAYHGTLVALIVPNLEAIRSRGGGRPEDLIREHLAERGARLPTYQRIGGFAITQEKLPRTQLGKPRRHLLPAMYERALKREPATVSVELSVADRELLQKPEAARLWDWLKARFADRPLSLDLSPQLDLGIDSLGWVDLTLDIQREAGVTLTEAGIARVLTLRDLLREAAEAPAQPETAAAGPPSGLFEREPGPVASAARLSLAACNRAILRSLFRLRVVGVENVPADGPCLICPNHASYLDPPAIAAALPSSVLQQTWWAGWTGIMFSGRLARAFSRLTQVMPVDPDRAVASSLAWGGAVLDHGRYLVWFPEGSRSYDASVQRFLPGIGALLKAHPATVVPAYIAGTFEAWPRTRRWPERHPITVIFGAPFTPAATARPEDVAQEIRQRVIALADRIDKPA